MKQIAIVSALCLVLAGCGATASGTSCAGWSKQTPAPETQSYIVNSDPRFARQVVGHDDYGKKRGCWK